MWKSRIGGAVVVLVGAGVIVLEVLKPTVGGWLWWIVGAFGIALGLMNILGVGRSDDLR